MNFITTLSRYFQHNDLALFFTHTHLNHGLIPLRLWRWFILTVNYVDLKCCSQRQVEAKSHNDESKDTYTTSNPGPSCSKSQQYPTSPSSWSSSCKSHLPHFGCPVIHQPEFQTFMIFGWELISFLPASNSFKIGSIFLPANSTSHKLMMGRPSCLWFVQLRNWKKTCSPPNSACFSCVDFPWIHLYAQCQFAISDQMTLCAHLIFVTSCLFCHHHLSN